MRGLSSDAEPVRDKRVLNIITVNSFLTKDRKVPNKIFGRMGHWGHGGAFMAGVLSNRYISNDARNPLQMSIPRGPTYERIVGKNV